MQRKLYSSHKVFAIEIILIYNFLGLSLRLCSYSDTNNLYSLILNSIHSALQALSRRPRPTKIILNLGNKNNFFNMMILGVTEYLNPLE
jgi:hypothetical protein